MKRTNIFKTILLGILTIVSLFLAAPNDASAHCDTLDGPVIQDAKKAIEARDITPILKWVKPKDENTVRSAFQMVLTGKAKNPEKAEHKFFATLVKIHRAGEGAPFAGLKPAGAVEPVIAEADKALVGGSPDALLKMVNDTVNQGIRQRYEKVAEALKHKDESVLKGREFVAAYVEYTHYVERIQQDAEGHAAHHASPVVKEHKNGDGHAEDQHMKHH